MQIGELSRRSGVSPRSLRHYEQHGLIDADRSTNGYREYGEDVIDRARNLHLLFALGIDRELARSVLACSGDAPPEAHHATREQLGHVRNRMADQIRELTAAHDALTTIIEQTQQTR